VVLVAGGGQAGLSIAATLGRRGVDTLVVDRYERVGDCWRKRYHSLALHNDTAINHLPYMPFPPSWPTYLPKDIGPDGEMNNMWKRTAQEGLWFVGGSFANCRTYSRYVALQIKAIEEGIAPQR
jgi:cation diffusion facilitator CzcD-associated flavoprotein CzcO